MPRQKRIYKERRVYFFVCLDCGNENRRSFKKSKQKKGICSSCKRYQIHKDQLPLF